MRSPSTGTVESPLSADFRSRRSGRNPDGTTPVGGLRMTQEFVHKPVMVDEVVASLIPVPAGLVVDATVGAGGHSRALLAAAPHLRVLGLDSDTDALVAAAATLGDVGASGRVRLRHARYDRLADVVRALNDGPVTAVLFDLGVSSPQLDFPERGFSYRSDGPLDMRMDRSSRVTAADVVNTYSEAALADLFAANGEGRFARRIARAIIASRPLSGTVALAETVKHAIPAATRRTGGHPAKRVFQAVRIEVNDELTVLASALDAALALVVGGGRVAVLSYHSGEDRLVKERFRVAATGDCRCPPGLPCGCGAVPTHRLVFRGSHTPSADEVAANPRAESARLRVAERRTTGSGVVP
jgi:16S rRNA (cytosine1402-N4)-methyltransferase